MRSASSAKTGINRKAIVMIKENSSTGTFMTSKGLSKVFKPSARSTGDVVAVRTVDTNMRKNNLKPKNIPTMTPSVLKAIGPNRKRTSCLSEAH